jgi:hypothetical protein
LAPRIRILSGSFIIKTHHFLSIAVLAGASLAAQAQSSVPDAAFDTHWKFGVQVGSVHDNGKSEPALQLTFGYEFNRYFAVEALASFNAFFERDGAGSNPNGRYEFNSALGARVLGTLPLSDRWSLVGGLGVVQVNEQFDLAVRGSDRYRTAPVVSAALMYRVNRRFGVGVEASTFNSQNIGLRGELHF